MIAQIRDKDKINGAFLLLKRFKNRLKAFDTALHALDKQKVNMSEFMNLQTSLDLARSQTIFEDMKRLFDTASQNFENKLQREQLQTTSLFERLLNDHRRLTKQVEQTYVCQVSDRIDELQEKVNKLGLQQITDARGGAGGLCTNKTNIAQFIQSPQHLGLDDTNIGQHVEEVSFQEDGLFPKNINKTMKGVLGGEEKHKRYMLLENQVDALRAEITDMRQFNN